MSQITDGIVDVTSGSSVVTGSGTEFTLASPGDLFIVVGDFVSYEVASVVSNTELNLSANYGGATNSGVNYVIHQTFTPKRDYPYPERGDFETANVVKQAIKKIDGDIEAFNWRGEWQGSQQYSERDYVFTVDNNTVTIWISNSNHTSSTGNAPGEDNTWQEIFSNDDLNTIITQPITWKGDWTTNTEHFEGDVVRHDLDLWISPGNFVTGATFDPNNWEVFVDVTQVRDFRDTTENYKDKAQLWANESEDVEVEPYEYSSFHWSEKSREWSNAAVDTEIQTGEYSSYHWSEKSRDWSNEQVGVEIEPGEYSSFHWSEKSRDWANEDRDVEVETGEYSAKHFSEVSDDWANAPVGQEIETGKYSARHWADQASQVPQSAYNWQGDWAAGSYNAGDAVFHVPSRSSYITLVNTSDEPALDGSSDWQLLSRAAEFQDADFLVLNDTPIGYTGNAHKYPRVNSAENALVFDYGDVWGNTADDNITITYTGGGLVDQITEDLFGKTRTTQFTYDANDLVTQVDITFDGITRTETYSYTSGDLTGISVTEA